MPYKSRLETVWSLSTEEVCWSQNQVKIEITWEKWRIYIFHIQVYITLKIIVVSNYIGIDVAGIGAGINCTYLLMEKDPKTGTFDVFLHLSTWDHRTCVIINVIKALNKCNTQSFPIARFFLPGRNDTPAPVSFYLLAGPTVSLQFLCCCACVRLSTLLRMRWITCLTVKIAVQPS